MDIKLQHFVRGTAIRLESDDAPAGAIFSLVEVFMLACDKVEAKQSAGMEANRQTMPPVARPNDFLREVNGITTPEVETPERPEIDVANDVEAFAEAPRKRGRPRKVIETVETVPAAEDKELGNVDTTPIVFSAASKPEEASPATPTSAEPTGEPESVLTPASPSPTTDEQPVITDTEMQRFCGRLATHWGASREVYDRAAQFVPEGAIPRPTNIRENSQRWAFIRLAEAESGLVFHG